MTLARFRDRWTSVLTLALAQLTVSWLVAAAITAPLANTLQRHPDGVFALYGDGGRLAYELFSAHETSFVMAGAVALVAALFYAAVWFALGATIPVLGVVEPAPSLHRAASYSVRRLPTLAALAAFALAGYGVAAAAGWYAYAFLDRRASALVDVRAADLLRMRAAAPALLIAALVTVWHDVARVSCVGTGRGGRASAVDALAWMLRAPLRTLGGAFGWALAGALGPLVAYAASRGLGARRELAAIVTLTALQQLALVWRFTCRCGWILGLGEVYRARAAGAAPPSDEASA